MVSSAKLLRQLGSKDFTSDTQPHLHFGRFRGFKTSDKRKMSEAEYKRMYRATEKLIARWNESPKKWNEKLDRNPYAQFKTLQNNIELVKTRMAEIQNDQSANLKTSTKGISILWSWAIKKRALDTLSPDNLNPLRAARPAVLTPFVNYRPTHKKFEALFNNVSTDFVTAKNLFVVECDYNRFATMDDFYQQVLAPEDGETKYFIVLFANKDTPQLFVVHSNLVDDGWWRCQDFSRSREIGVNMYKFERRVYGQSYSLDEVVECNGPVSLQIALDDYYKRKQKY